MLKNYLVIAFKVLLRRRFFTFISLFGISFTLMVLMVSAAFLDHMFSPSAPEGNADRMLTINLAYMTNPEGNRNWVSQPGYKLLDKYVRPLKETTAGAIERISLSTNSFPMTTYKNSEKIEFLLCRTDGEYWKIMDFEFLEGSPFTAQDEQNANFVAVINEAMRNKFFKGAGALGKEVTFDGQTFRVVGVVRNVPQIKDNTFSDIWVPTTTDKSKAYRDELMGAFRAVILARNADDFTAIQTACKQAMEKVEFTNPREWNKIKAVPHPQFEQTARNILPSNDPETERSALFRSLIIGGMLIFMLLPTINLININVSRIMERASEIGVRKAFGASSWTLVGQFVIENIFLTLVGGSIGLLLSVLVLQYINDSNLVDYANFDLNYRIFLYGMLITVIFGLFSGVYPAWKMSKLQPVEALKGGAK